MSFFFIVGKKDCLELKREHSSNAQQVFLVIIKNNPSKNVITMIFFAFVFVFIFLCVSLTRCLCHRASRGPYQRRSAGGTQACQTGSGQRSAAPALHRSCLSEGSTFPWTHLPGWPELKLRKRDMSLKTVKKRNTWITVTRWGYSPSMDSVSMALRSPRLLWGGRVNPLMLRPVRTRLDST